MHKSMESVRFPARRVEQGQAVDAEREDAELASPYRHPEDEDAQGLVDGLALGQRVGEALAHADAARRDDRGDAARHVHRAGAGEIDDAAVAERRGPERQAENLPAPHIMWTTGG